MRLIHICLQVNSLNTFTVLIRHCVFAVIEFRGFCHMFPSKNRVRFRTIFNKNCLYLKIYRNHGVFYIGKIVFEKFTNKVYAKSEFRLCIYNSNGNTILTINLHFT